MLRRDAVQMNVGLLNRWKMRRAGNDVYFMPRLAECPREAELYEPTPPRPCCGGYS